MDCPACGSTLEQHTRKGVLFLLCAKYPQCTIAGSSTLMNRFEALRSDVDSLKTRLSESREQNSLLVDRLREGESEPDRMPMPIGDVVDQLARLRILQSQMNKATTEDERDKIRKLALEVVR